MSPFLALHEVAEHHLGNVSLRTGGSMRTSTPTDIGAWLFTQGECSYGRADSVYGQVLVLNNPSSNAGGTLRTSTPTEIGRARTTHVQGECSYRCAEEREEEEKEEEIPRRWSNCSFSMTPLPRRLVPSRLAQTRTQC